MSAASLAETPKADIVRMYQSARSRIAKVREQGEIVTERATDALLASAGGFSVGLLRNKMGEGPDKRVTLPGVNLDVTLVVPAAMQLAGILGLGGKSTDKLLAVANGAAAGHWAIEAFQNGLPGEGR